MLFTSQSVLVSGYSIQDSTSRTTVGSIVFGIWATLIRIRTVFVRISLGLVIDLFFMSDGLSWPIPARIGYYDMQSKFTHI